MDYETAYDLVTKFQDPGGPSRPLYEWSAEPKRPPYFEVGIYFINTSRFFLKHVFDLWGLYIVFIKQMVHGNQQNDHNNDP